MHNLIGKINGQVVNLRSLTDEDVAKIRKKTEIITLEEKPHSEIDLLSGVLYAYDLPLSDSEDSDVIVMPEPPTTDDQMTAGRLHLTPSDLDPNLVDVKLYDEHLENPLLKDNEALFHQLNSNVLD